jgi:tetratricopeptide (TPR) repeat protein
MKSSINQLSRILKIERSKSLPSYLSQGFHWIEIALAGLSALVVLLGFVFLLNEILPFIEKFSSADFHEEFENALADLLLLAVAIEMAIMLIRRTPQAVVDVMFFVVARKMLIKSHEFYELMIGVVALAGLFAIRKYLQYVAHDFIRFQIEAKEALLKSSDDAIRKVLSDWPFVRGHVANHNDREVALDLLNTVASLMVIGGDQRGANDTYKEALRILETTDQPNEYTHTLIGYGHMLLLGGKLDASFNAFSRARDIYEGGKRKLGVAEAVAGSADVLLLQGDVRHAEESYLEALKICQAAGYDLGNGRNLVGLAMIASINGAPDEARKKLEEALQMHQEDGNDLHIIRDLHAFGQVELKEGNNEAAETRFRSALEMSVKLGLRREIVHNLHGLCETFIAEGEMDDAHQILIESRDLLEVYFDTEAHLVNQRLQGLHDLRAGNQRKAIRVLSKARKKAHLLNYGKLEKLIGKDLEQIKS